MHRLLKITNLFLFLTSPKVCRDKKKKVATDTLTGSLSTRLDAITSNTVLTIIHIKG